MSEASSAEDVYDRGESGLSRSATLHMATGPGAAGLPPQPGALPVANFTEEERILLRGLAAGKTAQEVGRDLRLPKPVMYRLLGKLRRKTGAADDIALAVWVVRHMKNPDRRRR